MSETKIHFLLIRFSSLGDVVLQTSVIKWLKATYGTRLRITFVTSHEFQHLLVGHPDIDQVLTFSRKQGGKLSHLVKAIRDLNKTVPITLLLDLHATTRSTLLRWRLWELPRLVVDKRRLERWLLVRWFGTKSWAEWKLWGLDLQVERTPKDWQGVLLASSQAIAHPLTFTPEVRQSPQLRPYVVFAPVASFVAKRWPMDHFVKLARLFLQDDRWKAYDLIIIAGPDDQHCSVFNEIQHERLFNLQGQTNLAQSMSWVQNASIVVGNDSGMNHLAEAGGVPVITLFGPTHEAFGFAPHLAGSQAISLNLWCRPCSATGSRSCFRERRWCMEEIRPEDVYQRMSVQLGGN